MAAIESILNSLLSLFVIGSLAMLIVFAFEEMYEAFIINTNWSNVFDKLMDNIISFLAFTIPILFIGAVVSFVFKVLGIM